MALLCCRESWRRQANSTSCMQMRVRMSAAGRRRHGGYRPDAQLECQRRDEERARRAASHDRAWEGRHHRHEFLGDPFSDAVGAGRGLSPTPPAICRGDPDAKTAHLTQNSGAFCDRSSETKRQRLDWGRQFCVSASDQRTSSVVFFFPMSLGSPALGGSGRRGGPKAFLAAENGGSIATF
jgi:hypothetical protein